MAIIPDSVREQLKTRFMTRVTGPVRLTLYTKPGSSRLILPAGMGCPTCEETRQMAELMRDSAPEKVSLEVVDVSRDPARAEIDAVEDVPTIAIAGGQNGDAPRIRFQGLPTGTEFPALVDAVERASTADHGLSETSLQALGKLTQDTEVLVFATPT